MHNPQLGSSEAPLRALTGTPLVALVGASVGLSIMGDSLMYSVLPLAAPALGISTPMVGILLSANRLVRLLSNAWASYVFERWGPRLPFLGSLGIGALATIGYGLPMGGAGFVGARLLWGIAWSGMRQGGYQAIWTGDAQHKGRLTGLLWGLVRLGSAISVLLGGWLYDRFGYEAAIGFVVAAGVAALLPALLLRWPAGEVTRSGTPTRAVPGTDWHGVLAQPVPRALTVVGFFEYLLSGVVVSTTAIFVAQRAGMEIGPAWLGIGVATVTGLLHGFRWLTDLALGPAVGAVSDRFGQPNTALAVTALLAAALTGAVILPAGAAIVALFVVLLCDGALHIVLSAAASGAARETPRPHAYIGVFTTTSDAGSALGPMTAYFWVEALGLPMIYLTLGGLLLLTVGRYWTAARREDARVAR